MISRQFWSLLKRATIFEAAGAEKTLPQA